MATRMQQRRGTAAQWISTNAGAGPVLNAGEMGWESDTNKFKIGDGVNNWASLDYFIDANSTVNPAFGTSIVFEGATADSYETTLQVTDPTADRTITFPDATGTVALTSDIVAAEVTASSTNTFTNKSISLTTNPITGTKAEFNTAMSDADFATIDGTETLTNKTLTAPVISSITNGAATLTLPTSTGTLALTTDLPAGAVTTSDTGTVTSTMISDGTIVNGDISASAAIDRTKISGTAITAADSGTVTSTMIADGTIVDGDINAAAAIAQSKIANLTTDLGLKAPLADPTFTGTISAASLTLSGDLTVNGTTTNINSTNLVVEDKNIVLGDTAEPADNTADGGGITLKGTTDKTFNWVDATDSWTSSEHINIASGKSYYVNGTLLRDLSETLTNKTLTTPVISSISNTGTLTLPTETDTLVGRATTDTLTNKTLGSAVATTAFTLNATAELRLADTDSSHYVGFKAPGTVSANKIWTLPAADGAAGQVLTTDGSGVFSFSTPAAGAAFSELMLIGA